MEKGLLREYNSSSMESKFIPMKRVLVLLQLQTLLCGDQSPVSFIVEPTCRHDIIMNRDHPIRI